MKKFWTFAPPPLSLVKKILPPPVKPRPIQLFLYPQVVSRLVYRLRVVLFTNWTYQTWYNLYLFDRFFDEKKYLYLSPGPENRFKRKTRNGCIFCAHFRVLSTKISIFFHQKTLQILVQKWGSLHVTV